MLRKITLFFSVLIFSTPVLAGVDSIELQNTRAALVARQIAINPGKPFEVAFLLQHREGWHSYWENPGEAGIPTSITWTLPEGFSAGPIDWPAPKVLREGPLAVYAYYGTIPLPVTITPPETLDENTPVTLKAKGEWLVCKEICIPESAELEITLPVTNQEPLKSEFDNVFEEHHVQRPAVLSEKGDYKIDATHFTLSVSRAALDMGDIKSATFFARQPNVIIYSAEQRLALNNDTLILTTERTEDAPQGDLTGLLLVESEGAQKYFEVTLEGAPYTPAPQPTPVQQDTGFIAILFFAMLGGLILNLMPCVLPVLSLKALAIAKKAGHEHAHVMKLGVAYTLGILVSFAVIAGILIGLQQAGQAVGWGYQMQSPAFVCFLVYLLFLVGLNLSGVFDLPVLLGNVGGEIANESSARGSFFTGILAAAVATPCTAPFMASAIGLALTLPAWQAMMVFLSLGFGLALPFLLISIFPRLLRFLPKPGAWMETFKKILALPMYASVVWLLWVLSLQTGNAGLGIALVGMVVLALTVRLKRRGLSIGLLVLVLAVSLPMLGSIEGGHGMMPKATNDMDSMPYSKQTLDELRKMGTPVFVDATAAWCITCQVNAKVAIHTEGTMQAFRDKGVILMIADWTRQNAEISAFLNSFGYQGVPLYVYYPPYGEPVVLPQILTEDLIISTITKKGE